MSKHYIDRYAFKVPLMFEGDRGSGKTFDVREFARENKHRYLEIAGHESVEAIDFLGHPMQSEHGIVWKDGKLSQAFRAAREGNPAVLLIDEMLRIPQRHLSVLLSALSPDSENNYRLQTGRMVGVVDGVGVEEEIIVPAKNIAIFATTNVGPEFAIDELDPAVAERFIIVRKDTEKPILTKILQSKAKSKSFNTLVAIKLVELFDKTKRMVDTGVLNRHATTRTLARALEHATDENDVKQVLKDQILLWVDRDSAGRPVAEQVKQITRTIDELFPDIPKETPEEKAAKAAAKREKEAKALAKAATAAKAASKFGDSDMFEEVVETPWEDTSPYHSERHAAMRAATLARLAESGGLDHKSIIDFIGSMVDEEAAPKAPTVKRVRKVAAPTPAGASSESTALAFVDGTSDKVYHVHLLADPGSSTWSVRTEHGRRGAKLNATSKCSSESYVKAKDIYDKTIAGKVAHGYENTSSPRKRPSI